MNKEVIAGKKRRRQGGQHVAIMNESEVARLQREIALSYRACLHALESPGITTPHAFITAQMERISDCQAQLIDLVGADAATRITAQALCESGEQDAEVTGEEDRSKRTMTIMERTHEITKIKTQVASSFHACMQLCTSAGAATHQATLKSYLKDLVGYQKELTILTGADEAMRMMFEAMEGGEHAP